MCPGVGGELAFVVEGTLAFQEVVDLGDVVDQGPSHQVFVGEGRLRGVRAGATGVHPELGGRVPDAVAAVVRVAVLGGEVHPGSEASFDQTFDEAAHDGEPAADGGGTDGPVFVLAAGLVGRREVAVVEADVVVAARGLGAAGHVALEQVGQVLEDAGLEVGEGFFATVGVPDVERAVAFEGHGGGHGGFQVERGRRFSETGVSMKKAPYGGPLA